MVTTKAWCAGPILRRALPVALIALLLVAPWAVPADAARLTILDYHARNDPNRLLFTPRCNVRMSGEILPGDATAADPAERKGDYERIKAKLGEFARHPAVDAKKYDNSDDYRFLPEESGKAWSAYFALCLSSDGGDLGEALKIARLFKDWMMVIEAGDKCYSACALIFMRGQRRLDGTHYIYTSPGRYLHHAARLGFHSPALRRAGASDKPLTPAEVADAYARALRTMRAVLFSGSDDPGPGQKGRAWRSFLHKGWIDRDLPLDILLAFLTVPPEEMFLVSSIEEAMRWGIEIIGLPAPRALTERMLVAACVNTVGLDCDGEYCSTWGREDIDAATDPEHIGTPIFWDESWQRQLAKDFRISRLVLMPKQNAPGPLAMQAFRMVDRQDGATGRYFCQIETAWQGDRMLALDITTFSGTDPDRKSPSNGPDEATMRKLQQQAAKGALGNYMSGSHLPLWKMLPGTTQLSDIAKRGWDWLDQGPNFFDKAPPLVPR